MSEFIYGREIEFSPVIRAKENISVFIPQTFPWEKEETAEIILNAKFRIIANMQAKLLKRTNKGIQQLFIPFEESDGKLVCDLPKFLEENNLHAEQLRGRYCNGTKWNQPDSTDKVLVCGKGMLRHIDSPYWGNQYEFLFCDKSIGMCLGCKDVKIMRFSFCDKDAWEKMESVFRVLISGRYDWDFSDFSEMLRYAGVWYDNKLNTIQVFIKDHRGVYDWTDISNLF